MRAVSTACRQGARRCGAQRWRIRQASAQVAVGRGRQMKIGLVLGGGGVTGAAWLIGALDDIGAARGGGGVPGAAWLTGPLDAIESATGWRASDADRIIGTSAGAVVGALVA